MNVNSNLYYNVELNECECDRIASCLRLLQDLLDTMDKHDCNEISNYDDITYSYSEIEDAYDTLYNIAKIEKMYKT